MAKKIIGIHGLANKPEKDKLEAWWRQSMIEGLERSCGMTDAHFELRLVYWADLLYKYPLHDDPDFSFDNLFDAEIYSPAREGALQDYNESIFDKVQSGAIGLIGAGADALKENFGMNGLADWMLSRLLKDLDFYYDEKRQILNRAGEMEPASRVLRNELLTALREEKDHDIMVVAHSMGSIIAYDALRDLGQSDPEIKISRFITIGSPLGLPHVKGKIIKERYYDPKVRTPSNVTQSWMNFADKKDPVAIDVHLQDDYQENASGIRVYDQLVANDYEPPGRRDKRNHHKSYGYLRTPEFSRYLKSFLEF